MGSLHLERPESLTIIGYDTIDGPEHPLYDERALSQPSDAMVKNIMKVGVLQNITCVKQGDKNVVVAGRRRVRAAREANRILEERGEVPIRVQVRFTRGTDAELTGIMIAENEIREDDDPLAKAKKAEGLRRRNMSDEDIGAYFGKTPQTIATWIKVLDTVREVQEAVQSRKISVSAAATLSGMAGVEQRLALSEMIAKGKGTVSGARASRRNATGSGKLSAPGRKVIKRVIKNGKGILSNDAIMVLRWVAGEIDAKDYPPIDSALLVVGTENDLLQGGDDTGAINGVGEIDLGACPQIVDMIGGGDVPDVDAMIRDALDGPNDQ